MPDRLKPYLDRIEHDADAIGGLVEQIKRDVARPQRWKNWLLTAALVAVAVIGLVIWRQDVADDRAACRSRNESRVAIRDAFGRLPQIGDKFLPDDDPLLVELRSADRELRESLPITEC